MAKRIFKTEITDRDLEILTLLSRGIDTESIAEDIGVSRATVDITIPKIMLKLGARTRCNAVYLAYKKGLIQ